MAKTGSFKFFGLPIYSMQMDYETSKRTKKFFGGIVSVYYEYENFETFCEKGIKILGKTFVKRIDNGVTRTYYCANIPIKEVSFYKKLKPLCDKIDRKHDDVYILNANSGEIYLFLTYIVDAVLKKNGSKNPIFIATKKYHCDLIEMLCPNIPYIYQKHAGKKISTNSFNTEGFRFFMIFDHAYFKRVENIIQKYPAGQAHYFEELLKRAEVTKDDILMRKIQISPDVENSMLTKIQHINLNLDKFVFLVPEANSCKMLDYSFWEKIIKQYENQGYDIFINLIKPINLNCNYKQCFLTYSEAFALAKHSKKIISLRCGFAELLSQTQAPMDVLYTEFDGRVSADDMSKEQVFEGFKIGKLPFINPDLIKEYYADSYIINALQSDDVQA